MDDIEKSKTALNAKDNLGDEGSDKNIITASPLDYHLFRQEITSKYPAYNPPPPLVPIELENNSILPPLPNHPSRQVSHDNLQNAVGAIMNPSGGSIFNQPVHIATPAPSPPPSPAGPGGKGGKKQNYQTNQNFPFLYPPLDDTSSILDIKGNAELQDYLMRKRWEGNDVPASILEAGQLFASRMRMTRSIRQLWDVREKYIKHERGWNEEQHDDDQCSREGSEFEDGDESEVEVDADLPKQVSKVAVYPNVKETDDEDVQNRLNAINDFYVCLSSVQSTASMTDCISSTILYLIFSLLLWFFGELFSVTSLRLSRRTVITECPTEYHSVRIAVLKARREPIQIHLQTSMP